MMDYPLLMRTLLLRAARYFPKKEILSIFPDEIFRYTYGDYYKRTCQLANALKSLGIKKGDRVASIALNNHGTLSSISAFPAWERFFIRQTSDFLLIILSIYSITRKTRCSLSMKISSS